MVGETASRHFGEAEGRHKACPYGGGEGTAECVAGADKGQAQGLPLRGREEIAEAVQGLGGGGPTAQKCSGW